MGVPHLAPGDHFGHLHARLQLVSLHLGGEYADLAAFHVVENLCRQSDQRPRRQIFQDERLLARANSLYFSGQAGGNLASGLVSDQGDFLTRLNSQANAHGVAGAGSQLRIESKRSQRFSGSSARRHCTTGVTAGAGCSRPARVSSTM